MLYVIGLGNPGDEYVNTRHNVGRSVVESLSPSFSFDKYAHAHIGSAIIGTVDVSLILPDTFMNRSGETLSYLQKEGLTNDNVVVVYDEVALPFGTIKVAAKGGDGGHNGMKSVIAALKTQHIPRIRIGIAHTGLFTGKVKRPHGGEALNRFVLGRFSRREEGKLETITQHVQAILETIATEGIDVAMNRHNNPRM